MVTFAYDMTAFGKSRRYHPRGVLRSVKHEKKELAPRVAQTAVKHHAAQQAPALPAAGLAGKDGSALFIQKLEEQPRLRRFPASVDALEGNKHHTHRLYNR